MDAMNLVYHISTYKYSKIKEISTVRLSDLMSVYLKLHGVDKKIAPHQKWLTWDLMATNNQNVNESFVFIFTCVVYSM